MSTLHGQLHSDGKFMWKDDMSTSLCYMTFCI